MRRRSQPQADVEQLRLRVITLLEDFETELHRPELRPKVKALIPAFHSLRDLGSSLMPMADRNSGIARVIAYFRQFPRILLDGDELMVVSGIQEWARRLRELRVEHGWSIYSGVTFRDIAEDPEAQDDIAAIQVELGVDPRTLDTHQYVLMADAPDREAAYRWGVLKRIRNMDVAVIDKLLAYFRENIGKPVPGWELQYLADDASEWARRARELRTQEGWPVRTKSSGRPDLQVGYYVLERDEQSPKHDRGINDHTRVEVLTRDHFKCRSCGWSRSDLSPDDPRSMLELHHIEEHVKGGANTTVNLLTLCNVCHDQVHRGKLDVSLL